MSGIREKMPIPIEYIMSQIKSHTQTKASTIESPLLTHLIWTQGELTSVSILFFYLYLSLCVVPQLIGYSEKPVNLQMFIGTADDRYLRPHAFYQVHRITGKTVATASQEIIVSSTKVLEIPLLPENNMSAR